jgi:hypothetical protein
MVTRIRLYTILGEILEYTELLWGDLCIESFDDDTPPICHTHSIHDLEGLRLYVNEKKI